MNEYFAGSYSTGGQTACTSCPPGYACANASTPGTQCMSGEYASGNAIKCTPCRKGFYCPSIRLVKKSRLNYYY
jgi:hypothetical protein